MLLFLIMKIVLEIVIFLCQYLQITNESLPCTIGIHYFIWKFPLLGVILLDYFLSSTFSSQKNMLFTRAFYTLFIVLWRTGISLVLFYTLTSIKNGRTCFFADFIGRQTNFNWIFNNFEYWKSPIGDILKLQ